MFIATARLLESEDWEEDHKRALQESFRIHFRNLWDSRASIRATPMMYLQLTFSAPRISSSICGSMSPGG